MTLIEMLVEKIRKIEDKLATLERGEYSKGATVDHGGLGGLADDDHTQYTQKATLTEKGDIYYASAASTPAALAHGTAGQSLLTGGHGANPSWGAPDHGGLGGLADDDHTQYGLKSGKLNQFASTTSAELAGVLSDETGSGKVVFDTSPTLATPKVDHIEEATGGHGVVIDGLEIKDGGLCCSNTLDGSSGWYLITFAMTYVSATQFTVSGNYTSMFIGGTKLRFTQTSVKHFVVISSAYSPGTGLTTVTITGGSDYTYTNAAIDYGYLSRVENPEGWPDWFNYAIAWTAPSASPAVAIGNGTLVGKFRIAGKNCRLRIYFLAGSTTAFGDTTHAWEFSLPLAPYSDGFFSAQGIAKVRDVGANNFNRQAHILNTDTTLKYFDQLDSGTNVNNLYSNVPHTWAETDHMEIDITYQYTA